MNEPKTNLQKKSEQLDAVTKPLRNLVWIGALLLGFWVQFIGPGISDGLKEFSGVNDLRKEMQNGFKQTTDRLDFIEINMSPPKVLNWIDNRQLGNCNESVCRVIHLISRTEYGEDCGIPIITIEAKLQTGEKFPFFSDFSVSEADISQTRIVHNFKLFQEIKPGTIEYQFKLIYPSCEWSREPLPRYSPWFKLIVSRNDQL